MLARWHAFQNQPDTVPRMSFYGPHPPLRNAGQTKNAEVPRERDFRASLRVRLRVENRYAAYAGLGRIEARPSERP